MVTRHYFEADPPAQLNAEIQRNIDLNIALAEGRSVRAQPLVTDAEMGARIEQAAHFVYVVFLITVLGLGCTLVVWMLTRVLAVGWRGCGAAKRWDWLSD